MADGVQTLEKRLQRLELLLAAEDAPSKVVHLDRTGKPGALEAKFDLVAREYGFDDHAQMAEVAHTQFVGVSLPFIQSRRVGVTTPEQAKVFLAKSWAPYSRSCDAVSAASNVGIDSEQATSPAATGAQPDTVSVQD